MARVGGDGPGATAVDAIESELQFPRPRDETYWSLMKPRYAAVLDLLADHEAGSRVVELGAEPCQLLLALDRAGYDATGVDVDPDRVRDFVDRHDLDVRRADLNADRLPFDDGAADAAVMSETFEHLFDPVFALREARRVLAPGGVLVLTTPNLYRLGNVVRFLRGGGFDDAWRQWEKREDIGHMGHVRQYAPGQVREFLERTGFAVVEAGPVAFHGSRHRLAPVVNLAYRLVPVLRPFQYAVATPDG